MQHVDAWQIGKQRWRVDVQVTLPPVTQSPETDGGHGRTHPMTNKAAASGWSRSSSMQGTTTRRTYTNTSILARSFAAVICVAAGSGYVYTQPEIGATVCIMHKQNSIYSKEQGRSCSRFSLGGRSFAEIWFGAVRFYYNPYFSACFLVGTTFFSHNKSVGTVF